MGDHEQDGQPANEKRLSLFFAWIRNEGVSIGDIIAAQRKRHSFIPQKSRSTQYSW